MLYQNEIFNYKGAPHRLLYASVESNKAWIIALSATAWPTQVVWSDIDCELPISTKTTVEYAEPSFAQQTKRDKAWERIAPLVTNVPYIFDAKHRGPLIENRAHALPCSERTLHKDLRRYWQGGQTKQALLANYHLSGRKGDGLTVGRGRRPTRGSTIFQLTNDDLANFQGAVKAHYLEDARFTIASAYQRLLEKHYVYIDGNGSPFINPIGSRPTLRQFARYLSKNFSLEERIRKRDGDKNFERNHRAKAGTVIADCLGVGHYYEIDATIVDVFLVSSSDVNKIVGKPTLYIIIDRKSRLIVGFYIGLENASWAGAIEAITSISADKRRLCEHFGVQYDPEDWPADKVFPKEFLADRGEMLSKASEQLPNGLQSIITNVPGLRPDWKSLVENSFKLIHETLKDVTPAYDPPSNATQRRGKHYEKDACLTLRQFGGLLLEAVIAHNKKAMPNYQLSTKEITSGILPTPITLWNHGIVERSGVLTRYAEPTVRQALQPRSKANVTAEGILFNGCYYTCPEAIAEGWLVHARKKRFTVDVSFDSRIVDTINILSPTRRRAICFATLTSRSKQYQGLSFAEVKFYEYLQVSQKNDIEQNRRQVMAEFHERADKVVDRAKKELKEKSSGKSRTARRADIKADRQDELRTERQARSTLIKDSPISSKPPAGMANNIVPMPLRTQIADGAPRAVLEDEKVTTQLHLQEMRRKMLNGI